MNTTPRKYVTALCKGFKVFFLFAALCAALLLSTASSRKPRERATPRSGPLLSEKASELGHPSLVVINTTSCLIAVEMRGVSKRSFFVIPEGAFRTLIAEGRYLMVLKNKENCLLGIDTEQQVELVKGRRYFLRLPPRDED